MPLRLPSHDLRAYWEKISILADWVAELSQRVDLYLLPTAPGTHNYCSILPGTLDMIERRSSSPVSNQESGVVIKQQKVLHLDSQRGQHPRTAAVPGVDGDSAHLSCNETEVFLFIFGLAGNRYWTHRKVEALFKHLQLPFHQYQSSKKAVHRSLSYFHQTATTFSEIPWKKNREIHRNKNILISLILVTCPASASAALSLMASEVFHPQVPRKEVPNTFRTFFSVLIAEL